MHTEPPDQGLGVPQFLRESSILRRIPWLEYTGQEQRQPCISTNTAANSWNRNSRARARTRSRWTHRLGIDVDRYRRPADPVSASCSARLVQVGGRLGQAILFAGLENAGEDAVIVAQHGLAHIGGLAQRSQQFVTGIRIVKRRSAGAGIGRQDVGLFGRRASSAASLLLRSSVPRPSARTVQQGNPWS